MAADLMHQSPSYFAVWVWLVFLFIISLVAVYLPFSLAATATIIFVIAAAKALLVAGYYMHLKFEQKFLRYVAIIPVVLFIGMTLTLIPDIVYNR